MPELRYQMTFEGKVSPEDEMGRQMRIESAAIIPAGLDPALTQGGRSAVLAALVDTDDYGGFTETGEQHCANSRSLQFVKAKVDKAEEWPFWVSCS